MGVLLVSVLTFVVTLGAAFLGLYAHKRLPSEQKNESARSIVGQVAGLVTILLAIVLGTLIGTSFAFFGGQKTTLEALSAQILELDQALTQYGPETKPARDRLRDASQKAYDAFWGGGEPDPKILTVESPMAAYQATKAFLAGLTPTTEAQKQAVASARFTSGADCSRRSSIKRSAVSLVIGGCGLPSPTSKVLWAIRVRLLVDVRDRLLERSGPERLAPPLELTKVRLRRGLA